MRWKKSVADKYVADWRFFELEGKSIRSMLLRGLVVGIVYGVVVAKIWPGLPGEAHRKLNAETAESLRELRESQEKTCEEFPQSQFCQQRAKERGNAAQIR